MSMHGCTFHVSWVASLDKEIKIDWYKEGGHGMVS